MIKGLKDDKKEQKLVNLKGKDFDLTNRRNLSAYVAFTHLIILKATNLVNCGLRSLYNLWALDLRTDIYIYNDQNYSNYIITYITIALNVINSSK